MNQSALTTKTYCASRFLKDNSVKRRLGAIITLSELIVDGNSLKAIVNGNFKREDFYCEQDVAEKLGVAIRNLSIAVNASMDKLQKELEELHEFSVKP